MEKKGERENELREEKRGRKGREDERKKERGRGDGKKVPWL